MLDDKSTRNRFDKVSSSLRLHSCREDLFVNLKFERYILAGMVDTNDDIIRGMEVALPRNSNTGDNAKLPRRR
ncbi:hypothetical protein NLM27_43140 [Bradyrhizobium sp. CCGB12]|uniref:hypothetical protein n=1 Tax=Bradyrhizobium sp. CCGB12 TaxID=2949632 RepID=UPI0020B26366|nr:hypothetical protein [Bradyrhizobium sp. CCGB12]MCP3395492.1 hypothetical protein [Bradyrhizobium sp. CCGB12]